MLCGISETCSRWVESVGLSEVINIFRLNEFPAGLNHLEECSNCFIVNPERPPCCSHPVQDCLQAYHNIWYVINFINKNNIACIDNVRLFLCLDQCIGTNFYYLGEPLDEEYLHMNALFILDNRSIIFGQCATRELCGQDYNTSVAVLRDVVAHEFCHLLISQILYPNFFFNPEEINNPEEIRFRHQPEALEESFCDIFAILINRQFAGTWTWTIAKGINSDGSALRYINSPDPDYPNHFSLYDSERDLHLNSTIFTTAFYHIANHEYYTNDADFLTQLVVKSIEKIREDKVTSANYLSVSFSEARHCIEDVAEILLQEDQRDFTDSEISNRLQIIAQAFEAVGIE